MSDNHDNCNGYHIHAYYTALVLTRDRFSEEVLHWFNSVFKPMNKTIGEQFDLSFVSESDGEFLEILNHNPQVLSTDALLSLHSAWSDDQEIVLIDTSLIVKN